MKSNFVMIIFFICSMFYTDEDCKTDRKNILFINLILSRKFINKNVGWAISMPLVQLAYYKND